MSKRIMAVDDSRLVKVQLEDTLKGTDYEIAAYCRSGEDAIEQYAAVKPDLVTMDIIMQGMDGLDAAEAILKSDPDARIVMVSSLAYDGTFERAKAIGARGFVDKPFHQEQLLKVFEEALSETGGRADPRAGAGGGRSGKRQRAPDGRIAFLPGVFVSPGSPV